MSYPAATTLQQAISSGATAFTPVSLAGLTAPCYVVIESEIIFCPTAPAGGQFTGVTRGALGTTAAAHAQYTAVYGLYSDLFPYTSDQSEFLNAIAAELVTIEARVQASSGGNVTAAGTLTNDFPVFGQGGKAIATEEPRGNTTVVQLADSTANPEEGNLAAFDADGNITDAGINAPDTPQIVARVDLINQTGNISVDLLTPSTDGDYVLNDYLLFTLNDGNSRMSYTGSWADASGAVEVGGPAQNPSTSQFAPTPLSLAAVATVQSSPIAFPTVIHAAAGTPINLTVTLTPGSVGAASVTPGNAGLGYAPGDTGTISGGGDGSATYEVLTVGAGGAVLTVSVSGGVNYAIANGVTTTVTTGLGNGALELNITALAPPGFEYDLHATLVQYP